MTKRAADLRAAILRWYLANRRDLPWRRTRDPYAVWVSEIMLQQTRVETAIPFYERFLARFPTVESLARARESAVLAAWSGLGYYRRARNLRAAAAQMVREHAGRLPSERDALRALPGVGDYTAAAIASVAFGRPAAAVDGNVIRVLARIHGLRGARDDGALRRAVTERAEALVKGPRAGDWTQALMELGALVCLPADPRCGACPAAAWCAARTSGHPDRYPGAARAPAPKRGRRVLLLVRARGRVLLVPDDADGRAAWTLPWTGLPAPRASTDAPAAAAAAASRGSAGLRAARALAKRLGLPPRAVRGPVQQFRHRTFAHDLSIEVWEADAGAPGALRRGPGSRRWVRPASPDHLPLRAPTLKALRHLRGRK